MSATQHLMEVMTRHQVFVQRKGGGTVKDVLPIFDRMLKDIIAKIAAEPTAFSAARIVRLGRAIEEIVALSATEFSAEAIAQINELAEYEAGFAARAVDQVVTIETVIPTANQVLASVSATKAELVSGKKISKQTLTQMFEEFTDKKPGEIARIVQAGFVAGNTTPEIVKEVSRVVGSRTKKQAESLVRTATNHAANIARQSTFADNGDIIQELEWVSALDNRTTHICMGRDGKKYPVDSGPRPPAHHNCRSTMAAVINPKYAVPGFEGVRSSQFGLQPTTTTYNSFLGRQSEAFQIEALGAERAKLFRDGGLHVGKFTDDDGITYNIEQLKALEPLAFQRAGIE